MVVSYVNCLRGHCSLSASTVWRTPSSTVISMVQGNTKRDGRVSASWFFLLVCPDKISHSPVDPHILTAGPSRLENNCTASSSPLRQLRNGSLLCELLMGRCSLSASTVWRTPSSTVIPMVQGNTKRNGRVYTQQAAHTSDTEVRRRNPMLRALQSCCHCRCPCI